MANRWPVGHVADGDKHIALQQIGQVAESRAGNGEGDWEWYSGATL